jgi:hypothetical protein
MNSITGEGATARNEMAAPFFAVYDIPICRYAGLDMGFRGLIINK